MDMSTEKKRPLESQLQVDLIGSANSAKQILVEKIVIVSPWKKVVFFFVRDLEVFFVLFWLLSQKAREIRSSERLKRHRSAEAFVRARYARYAFVNSVLAAQILAQLPDSEHVVVPNDDK